jgi:anti-anti-sigma factor
MAQTEYAVVDGEGGPVLHVRGEIDLATAGELRARVGEHARSVAAAVVLDVSAVTFIDSTGLKALVGAQADLGDGRRLTLLGLPPLFHRVLSITGMLDAFELG